MFIPTGVIYNFIFSCAKSWFTVSFIISLAGRYQQVHAS